MSWRLMHGVSWKDKATGSAVAVPTLQASMMWRARLSLTMRLHFSAWMIGTMY